MGVSIVLALKDLVKADLEYRVKLANEVTYKR